MANRLIIDHVCRSFDKLAWTDFGKGNGGLRLTMEMKNLAVVCFTIGHKKAAATKLTIVYDDNTLKHIEVKAF